MELGSAIFTRLFMMRTVRLLAGRVAILDQLASVARFEAIAAHLTATGGAFRRAIALLAA